MKSSPLPSSPLVASARCGAARAWSWQVLIHGVVLVGLLTLTLFTRGSRGVRAATPVTTVSAASFESLPVAPASIVSAFGVGLATQTVAATDIDAVRPGIQLPTTLGGSTVEVGGRLAELLFVSAGQINYIIPAATTSGTAEVVVRAADGTTSTGTVEVARVAPGIFSANASGTGAAAALLLRLRADGGQTYEPVAEFNSATGQFQTRPIDLGPEGERVFLILFLSGLRGASDVDGDGNLKEGVRLLLGGTEMVPLYAGPQPEYVGLDQLNVEIPRDLSGRGVVHLGVVAPEFEASNLVEIELAGIAGSAGIAGPVITGFEGDAALAGQELVINGSGFSPVLEQNLVRIAGLEADVTSASTTRLRVEVPYGVTSGSVLVRTLNGEGQSSSSLNIRTSISGFIEDTIRQPISGMTVRLSNTSKAVTTNEEGAFVLADVPPGVNLVEVDGPSLSTSPPYPSITLKVTAYANRDNQFQRAISIQQATGTSGVIGGGTSGLATGGEDLFRVGEAEQTVTRLQTDGFTLEVPAGARVLFPDGATSGAVYLTPLENARTMVNLPAGYFSSDIVQITPFNVRLDPGARLIFPNTDGHAPGARLTLFRFSEAEGRFVREPGPAVVAADGLTIETAANAVTTTSAYFVAQTRPTTTITGLVSESNGTTPVRRALVRFRGQEAFTDGTGSFVLRAVPVRTGEKIAVEISVVRPTGRVDRATSAGTTAVVGGITRLAQVKMPPRMANRPPIIQGPASLTMLEGRIVNHLLTITDPDLRQTVEVGLDGPAFATLVKPPTVGGKTYSIRLAPGLADAGTYRMVVTAVDSAGATTSLTVTLIVKNLNQPPVAADQTVNGVEDTDLPIVLDVRDADGEDRLTFNITVPPARGTLNGPGRNRIYRPEPNFFGRDRFTYRVGDGEALSEPATVTINIAPVNDPPAINLPNDATVVAGTELSLRIIASNIEPGQTLTLTTGPLPEGANFRQHEPAAGLFTWTPTLNQIGLFSVEFVVTDNGTPPAAARATLKITVVR